MLTKVRRSQGVRWFPFAVFGMLTLLATPFMHYSARTPRCATPTASTSLCVVYPTTELNEVVHQRARLGILTVTHHARRADFTYLRDEIATLKSLIGSVDTS